MTDHRPASSPEPPYRLNTVTVRAVWGWLDRAWADICAAPFSSLLYSVLFVLLGFGVTGGLLLLDMAWAILPMMGGFLLVGPVLGTGLYELSRIVEAGGHPRPLAAVLAFRRAPQGLLFAGLTFTLLLLAWLRFVAVLFALSFPYVGPSWTDLVHETLTTFDGAVFVGVSAAVGGAFAVVAFVIGVIALPVMIDRRWDFFQAARLSLQVVRANPAPLAAWAALIALFIGAGLMMGLIGLVPALMLIGHASWHAYRSLVEFPDPA